MLIYCRQSGTLMKHQPPPCPSVLCFFPIKYNTDLGDYGIMPTIDVIQQVYKCMKQEEAGFSRVK